MTEGVEYPTRDGRRLRVESKPILTTRDIAHAEARGTDVALTMTEAATASFLEDTRRYKGRKLAILVDGTIYQAPEIKMPIESGRASVATDSPADAERIASKINAR